MFSLPSFSGNTGQESRVFPHIGRRIVKTAIAVFLCLMIYALRGYEVGSMPTEAAIKAIPTMNEIVVERILNRTDLTFIRVLAKKAQNKIL